MTKITSLAEEQPLALPVTECRMHAHRRHRGTATVNDSCAKTMEANSTVKRSDILAVLSELSETMRNELNRQPRED